MPPALAGHRDALQQVHADQVTQPGDQLDSLFPLVGKQVQRRLDLIRRDYARP